MSTSAVGEYTPLYGAVRDGVALFGSMTGARFILLISDGQPTDATERESAIQAAKQAAIPVYTVGLGPAAANHEKSDPEVVRVLLELSQETGGVYSSADSPDALTDLFRSIAQAVIGGACEVTVKVVIPQGSTTAGSGLDGSMTVTGPGAGSSAEFDFTLPLCP